MLTITNIILLAIIQGLAELLPVSSSAHVIVGEKLLGIDPTSPQATVLLVMLHTGTMFAVILYFWSAWKRVFFHSQIEFVRFATKIIIATAITGVMFLGAKKGLELYEIHQHPEIGRADPTIKKAEIEQLFGRLDLIAAGLTAAGVLILVAGIASMARRRPSRKGITTGDSIAIGLVQGICLPFRGFSRSGSTISMGLLRGVARQRVEEFSFALAVVLTPAVVWHEIGRLMSHSAGADHHVMTGGEFLAALKPSLIGMVFSFLAGLVALKILSKLLEKGQWWVFGVYCLAAAFAVFWMFRKGY